MKGEDFVMTIMGAFIVILAFCGMVLLLTGTSYVVYKAVTVLF